MIPRLLTLLICLTMAVTTPLEAWEGKVVKVADGDTITVLDSHNQATKIRLYGVDCPEKKQAFGQRAKQFTASLVAGKTVDVETIDTDRYGRTVAIVRIGSTTLNEELLKSGHAWLYDHYCKKSFCREWERIEQHARGRKAGLWSEPHPQPPWEFRHGDNISGPPADKTSIIHTPTRPTTKAHASTQYHGNIESHKFHRPGCKHYDCKNCTATFGSREEAISAGYEPCGICKP